MDEPTTAVNAQMPAFFDFSPKPVAVASDVNRSYQTPVNGATFSPGTQIVLEIPAGVSGTMLDTSQTSVSFRIVNGTNQTLRLDKSATALIQSIDIFHGSRQLSSISEVNLLAQLMLDFTGGVDDVRCTGSIRGTSDYDAPGTVTAATLNTAYYERKGALIAASGNLMVCVPIVSIISSLSLRAWPTFCVNDNIRVVIKLADQLDYGVYGAAGPTGTVTVDNVKLWLSSVRVAPDIARGMLAERGGILAVPVIDYTQTAMSVSATSGYVSMPIAVRAQSMTAIFIVIRNTEVMNKWNFNNMDRWTGGDLASTVSYRFRIGNQIIPSSYVSAGPESRMELMRALGVGLSDMTARSCISAADYYAPAATTLAQNTSTAFAIGVSLQSFLMTDALADGLKVDSTIVFEANLGTQTKPLRIDAFCAYEKTLLFSSDGIKFTA